MFLFRLARGIGRGLASPSPRAGPPPVRQTEDAANGAAWLAIFLLLLPIMIGELVDGYHGHASLRLLVMYVVGFFILTPVAFAFTKGQKLARRGEVLAKYAPKRDTTTRDWRARAAELSLTRDSQEREERVLALLSVACPEPSCQAAPGTPCAMRIGVPVALVRKEPVTFCHHARMAKAIEEKRVTEREVIAQFDNKMPIGLLSPRTQEGGPSWQRSSSKTREPPTRILMANATRARPPS